jgi:hypothetical protein
VDFDLFRDQPLDRESIVAAFPFMPQSTVVQDERNALSVLVPYGDAMHSHVKVSLFGSISFGRVGEPDLTADGVLPVASLADLMATKVKVVLQRAEAKDYRDIAAAGGVDPCTATRGRGRASDPPLRTATGGKSPAYSPHRCAAPIPYFEHASRRLGRSGSRRAPG